MTQEIIFKIIDSVTDEQVGKDYPHDKKHLALDKADKLDFDIGYVRYIVTPFKSEVIKCQR